MWSDLSVPEWCVQVPGCKREWCTETGLLPYPWFVVSMREAVMNGSGSEAGGSMELMKTEEDNRTHSHTHTHTHSDRHNAHALSNNSRARTHTHTQTMMSCLWDELQHHFIWMHLKAKGVFQSNPWKVTKYIYSFNLNSVIFMCSFFLL